MRQATLILAGMSLTRPVPALLIIASMFVLAVPASAQDRDDDGPRAALVARYVDESGSTVERIDRSIAFSWGSRAPDRRLGRGRFDVQWQGFLMSQAPGQYRLYAYAAGHVRIKLGGQVLLDAATDEPGWLAAKPVDLAFDYHPIEIQYRSSGDRARVSLYWSGPQFQIEPISQRQLYHDPRNTPPGDFDRAELLVRALRCAACHEIGADASPSAAPALDKLAGNVHLQWLVDWLVAAEPNGDDSSQQTQVTRRMPSFGLARDDAQAIAAYLLHTADNTASGNSSVADATAENAGLGSDSTNARPRTPDGDAAAGRRLFLTIGCLACHQQGDLGESGFFGGGDLSSVAAKRPPDFFARWLADPAEINRQHRMPVFDLSPEERSDLAAYLTTLRGDDDQRRTEIQPAEGTQSKLVEQGRQLFQRYGCQACHGPAANDPNPGEFHRLRLTRSANWQAACTGSPDPGKRRPGYRLSASDQQIVVQYMVAVSGVKSPGAPEVDGRYTLIERNCLACHARDASEGLAAKLPAVIAADEELVPLLAAMTPPPLVSVGDKLFDHALAAAVSRTSGVHRPWLAVRMPKFDLSKQELQELVQYFVDTDRIPDLPAEVSGVATPHGDAPPSRDSQALHLAGARLVTADGFSCTSCHRVGDVLPPQAPLHAIGPNLSMLGERIRHPWFDRWVRNPARIIPRMEMPSVQLPVGGVLDGNLDEQLAAVWHVLNQPGFQPPLPDAIRVVRRAGIADRKERTAVLTDVLRLGEHTYIKPLLIGLANRHNVLFDLESNRLAAWWIGDVARQRTEGKSWYWETSAANLLAGSPGSSELTLGRDGEQQTPVVVGQFPTEFDELRHTPDGIEFRHRLKFAASGENNTGAETISLRVTQMYAGIWGNGETIGTTGFRRRIEITGAAPHQIVRWRVAGLEESTALSLSDDGRSATFHVPAAVRLQAIAPHDAMFTVDRSGMYLSQQVVAGQTSAVFELAYLTDLPVDQFPVAAPAASPAEPVEMNVVPGYRAVRLPIPDELMPTALAWRPDGTLAVASLKGRVWLVRDSDGDGLEDQLQVFSDELAAPYGLAAGNDYIDVTTKYALLRLFDDDQDGPADRTMTLASGWGHTSDYHDWIVGLPHDEAGNYYLAIPCQQDERALAAANLRGTVVKLVPRTATPDDPRLFSIEEISGGHRFPMGIARSRDGQLFVTDNQGNYNPWNELNHVVSRARYGFINALERKPGFKPSLTPAAIDIPHPWTRSVNGICFLDTPAAVKAKLGRELFGPFEGHLIGCEYTTRRLIRMSLQQVGGTYQGACYPFSIEEPPAGPPFLGPLACAVAPNGDLYVGSISDSGWGGSNNAGEVVRLRPQSDALPAGIAEVRAVSDGFSIDFTTPVDRQRAANIASYSISSYRRISTPAYGGPDVDRRNEKIVSVELAADHRRVRLKLNGLRKGFVYELQLKNLSSGGTQFFPTEAYYTLRQIPP